MFIRDKLSRNFKPRTMLQKIKLLMDEGADYHSIAFIYKQYMDAAIKDVKQAQSIIRRYCDKSLALGTDEEIEIKILDSFTEESSF